MIPGGWPGVKDGFPPLPMNIQPAYLQCSVTALAVRSNWITWPHTHTYTHHFLFFLPYSFSPPSHNLPLLIKILLLSYGWFHPKDLEESNLSTDPMKLWVTDSSPAFVKCEMSLLTQVNSSRWGFGWQREVRGKHNESELRNLCEVS